MKVIDLINRLREFDPELEVLAGTINQTFDITDAEDDGELGVVLELEPIDL